MARIKFTTLLPEGAFFTQQYPASMYASEQSASGFELHDVDGDYLNYIEVHGRGLKYKNGYLVGGTVTGLDFKNGDGDDYVVVSGARQKVNGSYDISAFNATFAFMLATDGKDTALGHAGDDILYAGLGDNTLKGFAGDDMLLSSTGGRDVMTGGAGSDIFVLAAAKKLVVTDFDAVGGGVDQDYFCMMMTEGLDLRIYQNRRDTVLDYSDAASGQHATVTLKNVDRADFSLTDDVKSWDDVGF